MGKTFKDRSYDRDEDDKTYRIIRFKKPKWQRVTKEDKMKPFQEEPDS